MKNAFYFTLKPLFVLKVSRLLSWLFGHVEKNGLVRDVRLTSKIFDIATWKQTITIHVVCNILRSKCNEIMKFGQLIQSDLRNIFPEKNHPQNVAEKPHFGDDSKSENWAYLWINNLKFYTVVLIPCPS